MLGNDFKAAMGGWLYPKAPLQWFWRSVGWFVILFLLFSVSQVIGGLLVYRYGFGGDAKLWLDQVSGQAGVDPAILADPEKGPMNAAFLKSSILGAFPTQLLTAIVALWLAHYGLPKRQGQIPLHWPKIGGAGWVLLIVSFILMMFVVMQVVISLSGAPPASGLVETTLMGFAKDPFQFGLAMLGVVLGAPLAEELVFRGALFAGIAQSRLGRVGAVIITSALWAMAHAGPTPGLFVLVIFFMGLALGTLLLRFGSLWVTIACHTAWNTVQTLLILAIGTHT